jgi:hypothetical protein
LAQTHNYQNGSENSKCINELYSVHTVSETLLRTKAETGLHTLFFLIPFIPCSVYKSNCSSFSNYFYSLVLRTISYAFHLSKGHLQWVQIYTITYASLVHN